MVQRCNSIGRFSSLIVDFMGHAELRSTFGHSHVWASKAKKEKNQILVHALFVRPHRHSQDAATAASRASGVGSARRIGSWTGPCSGVCCGQHGRVATTPFATSPSVGIAAPQQFCRLAVSLEGGPSDRSPVRSTPAGGARIHALFATHTSGGRTPARRGKASRASAGKLPGTVRHTPFTGDDGGHVGWARPPPCCPLAFDSPVGPTRPTPSATGDISSSAGRLVSCGTARTSAFGRAPTRSAGIFPAGRSALAAAIRAAGSSIGVCA